MYRKWGRTKPPPGATVDWGHPLATNLVGCWLLNEGAGSLAYDVVAKNNGVLVGPTWRPSNSGGPSLNFTSNYVNIGNVKALSFERDQAFSIATRFRTLSASLQQIFSKEDNGAPFRGWQLYTQGFVYFACITSGGGGNQASSQTTKTNYNDGNWHTAVSTYDGSSKAAGILIYTDGALQQVTHPQDALNGTMVTTSPAQISGRQGANIPLVGGVDYCLAWNRVLTETEAAWLNEEPFAFVRLPRSIQYFVPPAPAATFNAGRVQRGVVIGGGTI